jgi:hypothetical protein
MLGLLFYLLGGAWMIISFFIASFIMKPIMDRINPYSILGYIAILATLAISIAIGVPGVKLLRYIII